MPVELATLRGGLGGFSFSGYLSTGSLVQTHEVESIHTYSNFIFVACISAFRPSISRFQLRGIALSRPLGAGAGFRSQDQLYLG